MPRAGRKTAATVAAHAATTAAAEVFTRTLELCRRAKRANLNVTQGRVIDVFRALAQVDWVNPDDFRLALRANLASSREQEIAFDEVFYNYWHDVPDTRSYKSGMRPELIQGQLEHGLYREAHEDSLTDPENFSSEEVTRDLDLQSRWNHAAPPIEQLIRALAKRLATRPSRRVQQDRRGRRVDMRRSVRGNTRHGLELLELARVRRRVRKTRLVMLCDVSGSMDAFNPFLLQLMFGLQKELKNSRTLVFSTQVTEITALLRRRSVAETLDDIGRTVHHWSGGTNIGGALAAANRGVLREGSARATVTIIISDGYDNGDTQLITTEMETLRRRVRKVVWINPMYGASTFTVRAAGMRAALPYVDHFLPAFDHKSLQTLVRELALV